MSRMPIADGVLAARFFDGIFDGISLIVSADFS